ncbi:MAG: DUF2085 domain-containing protein [Candidatus Jordarchaeum sp.]|uniref:DUF2085 domain-containing protein n=1 Tax=Candidatus Jordarchaeum sp. TaxID=2823881 RepID=UPI00404A51F6
MIKKIIYIFLIIHSGSLVFISLLCPLLEFQRNPLSSILYGFLRNFCHQIPSRCLWIFGSNMGLCSRCFSTYLSFLVISIYLLFKNINSMNPKKVLLISLLLAFPLVIDIGSQFVTNYHSNTWLRLITGALAGISFALITANFLLWRW